jgi:pimeloyl-ACP methyl ester carboxylesterase
MSHPFETGMAAINGAELYYAVGGDGEPLLLLHAGVADSRMWQAQLDAFAARYRVIMMDMRGFGRSDGPAGKFSNVEDVRGLLDFLKVRQAHVLGISYGGLVAIDFSLAYPDRVKTLILGAPSVNGDQPSARIVQFWEAEEAAIERGELAEATELNLRLWVDGPQRRPEQVDPAVRALVGQMQLELFQKPVSTEMKEERPAPAMDRLHDIKVPVLILVGDLDLEEKEVVADKLVAAIPSARKIIIPDAAHMLNMEQPALFNRAVLDFLARHKA